jgi:hypothetical protein
MPVVTTSSDHERAGCLIGFPAQSSIDPARYVMWQSKANHTFRVGVHARYFGVHFLSEEDMELARLFGTESGDEVDTFARPLGTGTGRDAGPRRLPEPLHRRAGRHGGRRRRPRLPRPGAHRGRPGGALATERLSRTTHLRSGHESGERPEPVTERAP